MATARLNALEKELEQEGCHASWLCHRCLNSAYFGTFDSCSLLCRQCYIRILSHPQPHVKDPFTISAPVLEEDQHLTVDRRIPRIIHQSWTHVPRTLDLPELARIQATWRSVAGYEYHFYTPDRVTKFVQENYPPSVVQAFNLISNRGKRTAFFKMLVLFKVGGIFASGASVDVISIVFLLLVFCDCIDSCHHGLTFSPFV